MNNSNIKTELLSGIDKPDDIKTLSLEEMKQASIEIRNLILNKVSKVGGHVGPNLGVVELTLALHYVFDSPKDKIIWDVSHQSYAHKILTGRKIGFSDINSFNKFSGYTSQHESQHDFFTVGHTSTSISLAVGLAKARDLKNQNENIIALIGDGSLSGGLAFEGLNNGAELNSNLIIVVNDNEMSIDENFGGLYKNLQNLRDTKGLYENNIFKAMGFDYLYVEEGNDIQTLIDAFKKVKDIKHPIVVHIHTEKGHGYEIATKNKMKYHWSVPFDISTGEVLYVNNDESYNNIIIEHLDKKIKNETAPIVAINAGIPGMFGLSKFKELHPKQYFDVGIAESHSITFAAGLVSQGVKPVVFHASTFLQRGYDQLSHDIAINNSPVVIIVGGGTISQNSATHQGLFDIPLISSIPNIKYLAPTTKEELISMLDWALEQTEVPVAIRIPAHGVKNGEVTTNDYKTPKYEILDSGKDVAILALGGFLTLGRKVQEMLLKEENINPTLINPKFITELDKETLEELKNDHKVVITLEDGSLSGGFGEKIAHFYSNSHIRVLPFGATKEFTDNVSIQELYTRYNLTPELITENIIKALNKTS